LGRIFSIRFTDLPEWYRMWGQCPRCGHRGALDRWFLARRFGAQTFLLPLERNLRCTRCNNRHANEFRITKLPR